MIDTMAETVILVPARLESTRFPQKLLHQIRGKPLLLHVAERIQKEVPEYPLVFAVDDRSLYEVLERDGFSAMMTATHHESGSDRLAEANEELNADFVINVQADEPLITRKQILELVRLISGDCDMATLATPFSKHEDFYNPNQVKVVLDRNDQALYFSRSPIPYPRDTPKALSENWFVDNRAYRHLGLYAYTREFLKEFTQLPPGDLEQIEKLEQLRALENGYIISVGLTEEPTIGIDVPEDIALYEAHLVAAEARG
ncbi:MAG TPA: 3-deoxy-manno-octulosonate cytidylyltransferase [Opitutales bacterium]|nr:3-deoxy-manno-octulosonate cytidylyltransferase [Opitutales bacterium]